MTKQYLTILFISIYLPITSFCQKDKNTSDIAGLYKQSLNYELTNPRKNYQLAIKILQDKDANKDFKALALIQIAKYYIAKSQYFTALDYINKAEKITDNPKIRLIAESEKLRLKMQIQISNNAQTNAQNIKIPPCIDSTPVYWNYVIQHIYYKYIWSQIIYKKQNTRDSALSIVNKCIKRNLNYKKPTAHNVLHNLAKLYYAKAQIFEASTFDSPGNIKIIDTNFIDSTVQAYLKSIHYDNLLNNYQAWSRFSYPLFLLAVYANFPNRKKGLPDSAKKYLDQEKKYLNNSAPDLYYFQKFELYKTLALYYAIKQDYIKFFYYDQVGKSYLMKLQNILKQTIESQKQILKKQSEKLKSNITLIIVLTLIIAIISTSFIYILYKKNLELEKKNLELEKSNKEIELQKLRRRIYAICNSHKIKNEIGLTINYLTKHPEEAFKIKLRLAKIEENLKNFNDLFEKTNDKYEIIQLDQKQLQKIIDENIPSKTKIIEISPNIDFNPIVIKRVFEICLTEIIMNAMRHSNSEVIEILGKQKNKQHYILTIRNKANNKDFQIIDNSFKAEIKTFDDLDNSKTSKGITCLKIMHKVFKPNFDIDYTYTPETLTLDFHIHLYKIKKI